MICRLTILIFTACCCGACAQHEKHHAMQSQPLRVTVVKGLSSHLYQVEEATSDGEAEKARRRRLGGVKNLSPA